MVKISILKNVIYRFTLETLRVLIPVITVPYIYRLFNPEIMGNIEFSQSISGYALIFSGFGVYNYGLREISRIRDDKNKKDKLFTELFIISTISSIIVTVLYFIYIFLKFSNAGILTNMLLINSIQIISTIFYIEWINEAFENYKFISQKTIIVKLINIVFIFVFVKVSTDFYMYLFLINIFVFINNFISFIYIKKYIKFSFKNINMTKHIFSLFVILLIFNINMLYTQFDRLMLGFYLKDMKEVAYYAVSYKIMSLIFLLITAIISVSMPRLSFYLGENDTQSYNSLLEKLFRFSYFLLFPLSVGIIILRKEVVLFFGGNAYLPAEILIAIFGIRLIINATEGLLSNQVMFLHQKEKKMTIIYAVGACLNFIFKYFLIRFQIFSAVSAILTTMIAEMLVIFLDYFYIRKYLGLKLKIINFNNLKYLLFSLAFCSSPFIFEKLRPNYILYSLCIIISSFLIYTSLLLITKDKCLDEILSKSKIINIIRPKENTNKN